MKNEWGDYCLMIGNTCLERFLVYKKKEWGKNDKGSSFAVLFVF